MKKTLRFAWIPVLLFVGFSTPLQADVGSDTCLECHEEVGAAIARTPHTEANRVSCEACHGRGDVHADDPAPDNIRSFRHPDSKTVMKVCGSCHKTIHPMKSSHFSTGSACLNCHDLAHSEAFQSGENRPEPKLVKTASSELCIRCHQPIGMKMKRPYTHPSDEFENTCTACHNPHEARVELDSRAIDQRCGTCHPENKGPFMFTHLGADHKGCVECHDPHGSTNPNLLTRSTTRVLCLSCHTDTPAFHDQADPRYRQCTACHSAIHGSNMNKLFME